MAEIDPNTQQFSIHLVGERTGKTWAGDFRAKKRLSYLDRLRKDQFRRDLLGTAPESASREANNIAVMLSELKVRLTVSPEWWTQAIDGSLLEDELLLLEVWQQAEKIEVDATEALKVAAEKIAPVVKKGKAQE